MGFLGLSNTGTKIIFIGTTSLLPREAGSAGSCQSHIGNYQVLWNFDFWWKTWVLLLGTHSEVFFFLWSNRLVQLAWFWINVCLFSNSEKPQFVCQSFFQVKMGSMRKPLTSAPISVARFSSRHLHALVFSRGEFPIWSQRIFFFFTENIKKTLLKGQDSEILMYFFLFSWVYW